MKAAICLFEMFPDWFQDKYTMPQIIVRKMLRHGVVAPLSEVTLNLSLIKMPVECIDYVITRESHLAVFQRQGFIVCWPL